MIGVCQLLIFIALLLSAAQGNLVNGDNNTQTCIDLCASCGGTATFVDGCCECHIPEDKPEKSECVDRIKQQAEILGMNFVTHDLTTAERLVRCSPLGSSRRTSSVDPDRIANYFMNGGPLTGSPLLASSGTGCVKCCSDQMTGASNPSNAPATPEQSPVAKKVQEPPPAKNPSVGSPESSASSCGSSRYQPVVGSPWNYNNAARSSPWFRTPYLAAHQPYLGTHHSLLGATYYPHGITGVIPQIVLAIPNALMKATHIPAYNPPVGESTSPIVSALATGTHRVLQGISNIVAPYATDSPRNNVVGASGPRSSDTNWLSPQQPITNYPTSPSILRAEPSPLNPEVLRQLIANQNSLLEALSQELANYASPGGQQRVQYSPPQYPLASSKATVHCVCSDDSPSIEDSNNHSTTGETSSNGARDTDVVTASNPHFPRKSSTADETEESKNIRKMTEETETAAIKAVKKDKRETRQRSSGTNRKKRGDAKYKNKDAIDAPIDAQINADSAL